MRPAPLMMVEWRMTVDWRECQREVPLREVPRLYQTAAVSGPPVEAQDGRIKASFIACSRVYSAERRHL
jgi:hypothetical protein